MPAIREIIKGREISSAQANDTVLETARLMEVKNIGAIPVLDRNELVGVLSERDVVRRVVLKDLNCAQTLVRDVMTCEPLTVKPTDEIERCMLLMKQEGFRHLPVCDGNRLVGFVSMRDLLLYALDEKEIEVRMMRTYMSSGWE